VEFILAQPDNTAFRLGVFSPGLTLRGRTSVDVTEITDRVRQIVAKVTSIPAENIGTEADLRNDLHLDSLSLLEVGVNVDYEFKLNLPELDQHMAAITTVASTVALVERLLRERATATVTA
jgi:acyl carrier protein